MAASAAVAPRFDERLTAPRSWWVIAGLLGLSGGLVMFPLGAVATLGGLIVAAVVAGAAVSSYGSARVRVVAGSLVAGDARIPVSALGAAEVLDEEEARAWRTYKADPRAFMLMRSYVPRAVRVEITDPADPTPYAYLSSREPEALVAALESVRAEA
ncbi:Putative membrane protein [Streptomyces venezuelae]|nr:Putative membrane protein [Streptomyces venezuelae]